MELEIIYEDEYLVAINKPHGLLVHRTGIAADVNIFALQTLRNQIGQRVYPVHRIDRKTGGVLLFAKSQEVDKEMQNLFASRKVKKRYCAIVRGFTDDEGTIDYPLFNDDTQTFQNAVSNYKTLSKSELDIPLGKHSTSRYSLVEVSPITGRMHQIRKHFNHLRHPIIGDRPHGCNKQNKLFKERWNMTTMLLHASELEFIHPIFDKTVFIKAEIQKEFKRTLRFLRLE